MANPCHKILANNFRIPNPNPNAVKFPKVPNVFGEVVEDTKGTQLQFFCCNFTIEVSNNRLSIYLSL